MQQFKSSDYEKKDAKIAHYSRLECENKEDSCCVFCNNCNRYKRI